MTYRRALSWATRAHAISAPGVIPNTIDQTWLVRGAVAPQAEGVFEADVSIQADSLSVDFDQKVRLRRRKEHVARVRSYHNVPRIIDLGCRVGLNLLGLTSLDSLFTPNCQPKRVGTVRTVTLTRRRNSRALSVITNASVDTRRLCWRHGIV